MDVENAPRVVPKVAETDVEEFIQQELTSFAPMQPRPLSMQEVLEPWRADQAPTYHSREGVQD